MKPNPEKKQLDPQQLITIHAKMLQARQLEERLIKMYKQSDGYFWIGGPGEEALNVSLGLHIKKGRGLDYDFLHLHYRSLAIMACLGMKPIDAMRQMKNTASDPFSGGRNFANHFSKHAWNVVPISSTIETQYLTAIGSGIAHRAHGGDAITIVNGGDAGTAEGDFASCLIWASRPGAELPMLIIVSNNAWGISTHASTVHGEKNISDRGKAFGIKSKTIHANNIHEAYFGVQEAIQYVRKERKPFLLEATTSRLYGHSSATGCNYVPDEIDCLKEIEKEMLERKIITQKQLDDMHKTLLQEYLELSQMVKKEPLPDPSSIYDYTYANQKGKYW